MKKKWILWAVAIVVVIGLFSMCNSGGQNTGVSTKDTPDDGKSNKSQATGEGKTEQKETPKTGGTLVVGLGKEPGNPNPVVGTSSTSQFVKETVYESLLTTDDDGRIKPNLAESWEVSKDVKEFTLRLRKGVKFHNGQEMKADDVVWTVGHVKDPKNGAFGQSLIKTVQSVEKLDEYTVKFKLDNPSVTFLYHLSNIRMLPIIPANSLQPGQIKLEANTYIPGTGAFKLEKFQPGFDMVVKKFSDYWGSKAYLDDVIFRPITDDSSRFNALRTGDVQIADRLTPLDVQRVQKGDIKGLTMLEEPEGGYQHLTFNYTNPLFQKKQMREALSYAIDKQRLVEEVFFGSAKATDLMMPPQSIWAKAAALPPHKRDVAKAKQLLQEAGYKGEELVIVGRKTEAQTLESFQRIMGEAGVKIKIEILEAGVMNERTRLGQYDLYIDGGNVTSDPYVTMINDYYTNNVEKGKYGNPKVDQMFEQLDDESDEKKRLEIFKQMINTIHVEDVADVPLFFEARFLGLSAKVQNYGPPKGYSYHESGNYFKQTWLK